MKLLNHIIIGLIFVLAGVLFVHNLTSVNADIGRHIKLGEVIWQIGEVPKTNLFSYTAQDFPFINHHWLSEVVFYKIYSLGSDWISSLKALIFLKIAVLLTTYFMLFLIVRKHNIFAVVLSFLVSIFVFSARTEPRPEIFSYLIFAAFLVIIYRAREDKPKLKWLLFLPILQLLWVNLHIYFIIGPIIYFLFLTERAILKRLSRRELLIGVLVVVVNLVNPNFIYGAMYPFRVFSNYGYSVAENSSLFFLARYFGYWAPQDKLFLVAFFILAGSFILSFFGKKLSTLKTRTFDLLLIVMTATLSFKMQRNIPLFSLGAWSIMSENLDGVFESAYFKKLEKWFRACAFLLLIVSIYLVLNGQFYNYLDSAKVFGLGVSSAAQDGTDFIKVNKIQGPMFNNFDIGSYLIWQLYPEQKVFIDGRPEAYPVEFFEKVYKPMQRNEKVWREMSERYGINYVFFAHTDMTEWADEFLRRISKDKEWSMVFVNDAVVIFLKNTNVNQLVIDKYAITDQNVEDKTLLILDKLNKKDDNAFVNFGNALYRFRWLDASAKVYEALIENQPDNPYGYQGAAYAYTIMNDPATQEKAAQNLEKAISLGFKTFDNYFTLGIINANLDNLFAAEENIRQALEINPDNQNAKDVLKTIRSKLHLQ